MKELLKITNLKIQENDEELLNIPKLSFFEGVNTYICGTSGSGKTLLLKVIASKIKCKGKIIKKCKVEVVFLTELFYSDLVEDELRYLVLNAEQKEFVHSFLSMDVLKENPNDLPLYEKKILLLLSAFMKEPDLLFIDNVLSFLKKDDLDCFLHYASVHGITIVCVSNDIEDVVNYPNMFVFHQGGIVLEGETKKVLKEEKILKRLGVGLPFCVDLSIQLKLYGVLKKICTSSKELVRQLWK